MKKGNKMFTIAKDKKTGEFFITNIINNSVLNIEHIKGSEFKKMFSEGSEPDAPYSSIKSREDAQKILENINDIYVE